MRGIFYLIFNKRHRNKKRNVKKEIAWSSFLRLWWCINKPCRLRHIKILQRSISSIKSQSMYLLFFYQASIVNLTGLKSDLFNINVEIHNFLADLSVTRRKDSHNSTPQQRIPMLKRETITSTTLRDKVVALYAMWDEAFHR